MRPSTPRIALVGANGYGHYHRREIALLHDAGVVDLVGLCDHAPIQDEPDAPLPPGARLFTDHRRLLAATRPDVVVIASPPHTHLEIATAAARAGADVLLEKPPFLSLADQDTFTRVCDEVGAHGRTPVCQVGFQALGSAAMVELTEAIQAGRLGRVTGIGAFGAWWRPDSYYQRATWAGRRELDGRPVLDGALANPFAHAVMQSIAVAEVLGPVRPASVELERYRARPIEVDDTGAVRVRLDSGLPIVVAVTLCADVRVEAAVVVHGTRGSAVLEYTRDRLRLPGEASSRLVPGRVSLLENLLAFRSAPDTGVGLLAGLGRTVPFTTIVEAIRAADQPVVIDTEHWRARGSGPDRVVTVPGVSDVVRAAAMRMMLPSELGVSWADRSRVAQR